MKQKLLRFAVAILMCLSLLPVHPEFSKVAAASGGDLVLHLKFDRDLKDSSGNSLDGDCTYGEITYEEGIFGDCAVFDGKSYIEVPDADALDLKDNLTITLWAYKEKMKEDYVPFVYKEEDGESWAPPYKLYEHHHLTPTIAMHDGNFETELNQFMMEGKTMDIRKWFMLTVTYNGSEVKMYHNNELVKKQSVTGSAAATVGKLYIGMLEGSLFYKGKMDELRIYNRAISASEVSTLYNEGVNNKPTLTNQTNALVAHYKFEDNFLDSSGKDNNAEKVTGEGTVKFVDGVNGKAAKFTKGSYLEVKDSDILNFDQSFSMTGWICINKKDTLMPLLNRVGASNGDNSNDLAYGFAVNDDYYEFKYSPFGYDYKPESDYYSLDSSLKGKWFHIGVTFDGTEIHWYKNGKLVQQKELEELQISHSNGSLMIGSDGENFLDGTIDELKLYNYELSNNEVKNDFNQKDSISISSSNKDRLNSLKVKDTLTLTTSRKYIERGNTVELTSGVTYKSSNNKIFTVSNDGKITAVKKGKAKLTVSHGGISVTYTVNVK